MISLLRNALFVTLVAATAGSAAAQTVFDFANLKYENGVNTGFLPLSSVPCTGGDLCSSDVLTTLAGELVYAKDGITVRATGSINGGEYGVDAAAVQDHENGYNGMLFGKEAVGAGLGVYSLYNTWNDDNVSFGETIRLRFDAPVTLSSVGMRADGHGTLGWSYLGTFQYSFDNTHWTTAYLPKYYGSLNPPYDTLIDMAHPGQFALSHTGQDFYFRHSGNAAIGEDFYISSVTIAPVSEPETYALMFAGLGMLGLVVRRRRPLA